MTRYERQRAIHPSPVVWWDTVKYEGQWSKTPTYGTPLPEVKQETAGNRHRWQRPKWAFR